MNRIKNVLMLIVMSIVTYMFISIEVVNGEVGDHFMNSVWSESCNL